MNNKPPLTPEQDKYTIDWFTTIHDLWSLSWSFLQDVSRSFSWKWTYREVLNKWINFSWKRFYTYWDDIFMFEYESLDDLNNDSKIWKERLKKKNSMESETVDWRQILESSWYFEMNWKYYLLWLLYQDLHEDDTDENKWVYKWVIVNPVQYFEVEGQISGTSKDVWEIL